MSEQPPSKGLKPVTNIKMLNFVYWVATNYPDIRSMRYLDDSVLMQLIEMFEQNRPDLESDTERSWRGSINKMLQGDETYQEARAILERTGDF